MNQVFADTFYFMELLNSKDIAHAKAWGFSQSGAVRLVTTEWVLTEVANTLARSAKRHVARRLLEDIKAMRPITLSLPRTTSLYAALNSTTRAATSIRR